MGWWGRSAAWLTAVWKSLHADGGCAGHINAGSTEAADFPPRPNCSQETPPAGECSVTWTATMWASCATSAANDSPASVSTYNGHTKSR